MYLSNDQLHVRSKVSFKNMNFQITLKSRRRLTLLKCQTNNSINSYLRKFRFDVR